jgi:hypothetical protein
LTSVSKKNLSKTTLAYDRKYMTIFNMKRILYFFFLFLYFISLGGCSFKSQNLVAEFREYRNEEVKISLQYPYNWKPDVTLAYLGNQPSRYFGLDGFFAVNVIASDGLSLEVIANQEAQSGDYGQNPQVERVIHNAKIGYLIFPSSDQRNEENQRSCFITELRNIYRSNRINFDILILFADHDHLKQIMETLENL